MLSARLQCAYLVQIYRGNKQEYESIDCFALTADSRIHQSVFPIYCTLLWRTI